VQVQIIRFSLLEYGAVWVVQYLTLFWRNVLPPSLGLQYQEDGSIFPKKAATYCQTTWCNKMLVYVNQTTQHHIPEAHNCNTHHKNLKSHKYMKLYKLCVAVLKCRVRGGYGPKVR
jgi:hypothetical protein